MLCLNDGVFDRSVLTVVMDCKLVQFRSLLSPEQVRQHVLYALTIANEMTDESKHHIVVQLVRAVQHEWVRQNLSWVCIFLYRPRIPLIR